MLPSTNVQVLFIAGFGPIVRDTDTSRAFYRDALGLPFEQEADGYLHTEGVAGTKRFALSPRSQAAQSCFGDASWPADVAVPQASLEFDVDDVERATPVLEATGYRMLVKNRTGPRGRSSAVSCRRTGC